MPRSEEKRPKELHARLVTPEEMPRAQVLPPQKIRPIPVPPPVAGKMKPLPPVPPNARRTPARRTPLPPPPARQLPSPPATPTIPGEGRGIGKAPTIEEPRGTGGTEKAGEGTGSSTGKSSGSSGTGVIGRDKLFDQGIIEGEARKGSGSPGKAGEKDSPVTFDTKEYRFAGYMTRLREKIESIWVYPPEAAQRGIYGDLKIQFTIRKDGRLGEIRLVRTSGYKMLDDAAIKALKDGEAYWPLPEEWHMDSYTILGHFVYTLYGYRLR